MKKIIIKLSIIIFLTLTLLVLFLSTVGIETSKLNNQIEKVVNNLSDDLEIELKKIKILLDPFSFKINAKTVGTKIKNRGKVIEIETVRTKISIKSFVKNEFSLSKLQLSTKSLELKNLISFSRTIKDNPQLYLLEKLVKRGYFIADIKIEFDKNGKIKKNFEINGFVKNTKLNLLKKYNIDKLNFTFEINNQSFKISDSNLLFNKIPLNSKSILIKKIDQDYSITGDLENKSLDFKKDSIDFIVKKIFPKINIKVLNINSKNIFSLKIDKYFKINDLKILSEIKLNNLVFKNNIGLESIFPNIKEEIIFSKNKIRINFDKEKLSVKGEGDILFQNEKDKISYSIDKHKEKYKFKSSISINKNPLIIELLNYEKKGDSQIIFKIDGNYSPNKKMLIKSIFFKENKNQIKLKNLFLDENFNVQKLEKVQLNFFDKDNLKNQFDIINKKNDYSFTGTSLNANKLIENLIDNKDDKKLSIFNNNFNINLKLENVYLDTKNKVRNLKGKFYIKNNEILNGELNAIFSQDKNLKFTINSNQEGKVTTLFFGNAEPIVKRYKFIKGFKGGSLDFYSLKNNNINKSKLKIYDFKLKELPLLTKLLTLASLQGIADVLSGEGIRFKEFEMNFENENNLMTIKEIYAIGPAISVLMEGYIEKNKIISLRGTLVPATTLNKVIGSIPFLGDILVGSKSGEGVFGVSFKIKGHPKNPETTVNPIKTLTPRFITRTLEKIKKN